MTLPEYRYDVDAAADRLGVSIARSIGWLAIMLVISLLGINIALMSLVNRVARCVAP